MIGLAYLLVEIPLIQRFILFLGHPAYALTAILFSLLLFSGLGSHFSDRMPFRLGLACLAILLLFGSILLPRIFDFALGFAFPLRLGLTVVLLAPLGFLMGVPFPKGIGWITHWQDASETGLIPWVWAVNGAASVVASVLAALLALSVGFDWVLRLGALCYFGAWLVISASASGRRTPHPRR